MMAYSFNSSIWEAEQEALLRVWGQSGLQRVFQDSQGYYTEKTCLKKPKERTKERKGKEGEGRGEEGKKGREKRKERGRGGRGRKRILY